MKEKRWSFATQDRGHKAKYFENGVFLHTAVELYNTVIINSKSLWENDVHVSLVEKCHLPKSCIFQALIKHDLCLT